tara:strand:+ start:61143 stop:62039 length:897 start_codon:yes stop_codon:yes gene_type:complete
MKIANAPCSWGVLEFGLEGQTDHFSKVLDEMSETGYLGTELGDWGFMPTDPKELVEELQKRDLNLVGAFVPVNFIDEKSHKEGAENAVKIARLLKDTDSENARIVLSDDNGRNKSRTSKAGRIKPEDGLSDSEMKQFAKGVEYVAQHILEKTGLISVFHHHCAGFIETPNEIERLLYNTDKDLVSLCFDTGHYEFGGGNALHGLKHFSDRIRHVHFKDFDKSMYSTTIKEDLNYFESVRNGIFCELGKGSIPFDKIYHELKTQNYDGWIVVEQDVLPGMGSPKASALRNREYLSSIGI